jgi:DNA-binding GntR family transcriptional regulator
MNIRSQVHLFLLSHADDRSGWRDALLAGHAGHTGILDAIRAGDERAAARRAVEHVAAASGRLLPGLDAIVPLVLPPVPPAGRA